MTIARAAEASNEGAAWLGAQERRPPLRWQHTFSLFWFGETISVLGNTTSSVLLPLLAVVELQPGQHPGVRGCGEVLSARSSTRRMP